jgi:hypothetical protein
VTLVSWGKVLEVGLRLLLVQERQLQVISSPVELAKGIPSADVVVVDVPAEDRRAACERVRRHHRGRLLVLLDPGDSRDDLPPYPHQTLLTRPFFVYELSAALAGSRPTQPTPDPANQPPAVLPRKPLFPRARSRLGSDGVVAHVVLGLMRSWRERRLVGLSAVSLTAVLLVGVVFVLIAQGAGCGLACDELTGADRTSPPRTTVIAVGPATTASSVGLVGPTTTDSSVDPTTGGRSRVNSATSRPGIAKATAESSGTPRSTSPPDPTPPPTAAPTTAPTTTTPKPSTTITTTTTTTTTRPRPPDH